MSLLEGLLEEGPSPRSTRSEVWFALRTDGVMGSGTESDPYDGSLRFESALSVYSLNHSGTGGMEREATVVTDDPHGYLDGNIVTIAGVTGAGGQFYNGTFVIYGKTDTTFKFWMNGIPPGAASGSITCARTSFLFDDIRAAMGSDVTIHVGPGVFLTKGHPIMSVFSGHKIIGSGMQATTVRLVAMVESGETCRAFGSYSHLQSFEISDLTIDCNLPDGIAFPPMNCGAIWCQGDHLRYRRVRAINFGTLREGHECFVLASGGANPTDGEAVDCVIEDCIVEQPALSSAYQTTCIIMSGGERSTDGVMEWNRACAIRNCVVDCEYKINPVPISGITVSGNTATVTTAVPHGRTNNQWVRIAGCKVNGASSNILNGSFQIAYLSPTTFQYSIASGSSPPAGDMWVDRFPSHAVPITSIPKTNPPGPFTITVTTPTPHFRVPGEQVLVGSHGSLPGNGYLGLFVVAEVVSPTQFKYVKQTDPGDFSGGGYIGALRQGVAAGLVEGCRILNVDIGGPYHDTWTQKNLIVRNNYYHSVIRGPYENLGVALGQFGVSTTSAYIPIQLELNAGTALATMTVGDPLREHGLIANVDTIHIGEVTGQSANCYNGDRLVTLVPSDSQFRFVPNPTPAVAPEGNAGGYATPDRQRLLTSLTAADEHGQWVATAETYFTNHGLSAGDAVRISRASHDFYNGYHSVTWAPPPEDLVRKTFKYVLQGNPGAASPSGYFGRLWQTKRILIEDNVIELKPAAFFTNTATGILLGQASFSDPPLIQQAVVRRNVIRFVDNATEPYFQQGQSLGLLLSGCAELLVEDNVIDLAGTTPIKFTLCDKVKSFNNTKSNGELIQCVAMASGVPLGELATDIEDAAILAF